MELTEADRDFIYSNVWGMVTKLNGLSDSQKCSQVYNAVVEALEESPASSSSPPSLDSAAPTTVKWVLGGMVAISFILTLVQVLLLVLDL